MQSIIKNIYLKKPPSTSNVRNKILSIQSTSGCANDLPTGQMLNARTKVAQLSRFDKLEFLWREDRSLRFPALANKLLQMHRLRVGFTITITIITITITIILILIIISTIWPLATALDEGWVGLKGSCRALLGSGAQMKLRKGRKWGKITKNCSIEIVFVTGCLIFFCHYINPSFFLRCQTCLIFKHSKWALMLTWLWCDNMYIACYLYIWCLWDWVAGYLQGALVTLALS